MKKKVEAERNMTSDELISHFVDKFQPIANEAAAEGVKTFTMMAYRSDTWVDNCKGNPVTKYGFVGQHPPTADLLELLGLLEYTKACIISGTNQEAARCIRAEIPDTTTILV